MIPFNDVLTLDAHIFRVLDADGKVVGETSIDGTIKSGQAISIKITEGVGFRCVIFDKDGAYIGGMVLPQAVLIGDTLIIR